MMTLPQSAISASQFLSVAKAKGEKGTLIKRFKNGQVLVEYACTWVPEVGDPFVSNMRIRAFESEQCL